MNLFGNIFRDLTSDKPAPLWGQIVIAVALILGFASSTDIDKTMACKNYYSYCTVTSHNLLKIKTSKRLIIPSNVSFIKIESYQKDIHGRRSHRRVTRYLISVVDKAGKTITVFDNYKTPEQASEVRKQVQTCIEQGPYPCTVNN